MTDYNCFRFAIFHPVSPNKRLNDTINYHPAMIKKILQQNNKYLEISDIVGCISKILDRNTGCQYQGYWYENVEC